MKKEQPKSALERMGALGLILYNPSKFEVPPSSSQVITTKKPQTLAEALVVSTKAINFSQEFGDNPIWEGHSAAKYLKNIDSGRISGGSLKIRVGGSGLRFFEEKPTETVIPFSK
jgi:hypothetical protein